MDTKYHDIDISSYNFLITGGAGFIGSHLTEYLINHSAGKVRVIDDFSTGLRKNISQFEKHPYFELIEGDIRDAGTCRNAMQGMHFVLHQAALGSVPRSITNPIDTNDVNITGFLNILIAAKESGVKRIIYAASSSTYGDSEQLPKVEDHIGKPLSPYGVTKLVNELYADVFSSLYGCNVVGLRYFNVFGPRQNPLGPYAAVISLFIKAALNNEVPTIYGDGATSRDFTFIENVVQANIKALFAEGLTGHHVFNIACGKQTTLNELWHAISAFSGINETANYSNERKGDIKYSQAFVEKAREILGYVPGVYVQEGLEITYDWYKEQNNGH